MPKATHIKKRLLRLCRQHPKLRQKLAREIGKLSKVAGIDDDPMGWEALHKISDQAPKILELLRQNGEELEDWQEAKLLLAAEYIDAVHDALAYGRD